MGRVICRRHSSRIELRDAVLGRKPQLPIFQAQRTLIAERIQSGRGYAIRIVKQAHLNLAIGMSKYAFDALATDSHQAHITLKPEIAVLSEFKAVNIIRRQTFGTSEWMEVVSGVK